MLNVSQSDEMIDRRRREACKLPQFFSISFKTHHRLVNAICSHHADVFAVQCTITMLQPIIIVIACFHIQVD